MCVCVYMCVCGGGGSRVTRFSRTFESRESEVPFATINQMH